MTPTLLLSTGGGEYDSSQRCSHGLSSYMSHTWRLLHHRVLASLFVTFGRVIYRSKLPSPSILTTITPYYKVKYNSKLYLSFRILYKGLFLVDGSSLSLWGREEVIRTGLYSRLVVEYCRWMKKTIFVTMNLMRVTRSGASVVCDCWMRSFWSTPEARVLYTLA